MRSVPFPYHLACRVDATPEACWWLCGTSVNQTGSSQDIICEHASIKFLEDTMAGDVSGCLGGRGHTGCLNCLTQSVFLQPVRRACKETQVALLC